MHDSSRMGGYYILKVLILNLLFSCAPSKAMKDAKRETIYVNEMIFKGDAEKLMKRLQLLVLPLVGGKEKNLASAVCRDIIRASSRTAGGGDAYCVLCSMFSQSNDGYMITPKAAQSKPITVVVDGERGEVCMYYWKSVFCVALFVILRVLAM